jgi:hypothetical protein
MRALPIQTGVKQSASGATLNGTQIGLGLNYKF